MEINDIVVLKHQLYEEGALVKYRIVSKEDDYTGTFCELQDVKTGEVVPGRFYVGHLIGINSGDFFIHTYFLIKINELESLMHVKREQLRKLQEEL